MRRLHYARLGIVFLAVFGWFVTGCGDANDSHSDINDDEVPIDMTPWTLVANYDGYPNVAIRCAGPDRMFTTTRSDSPLIVIPDATACRDGEG